MALAFKVAGNSYHRVGTTQSKRTPQRYYQVSGVWPRYEVTVMWDEATRKTLWGTKALKAFEVAMRIEGYKRHGRQTN